MAKAKDEDKKQGKKKKQAKKAGEKGVAKKNKPAAAAAPAALSQPCLDSVEASFIVGGCLLSGTHNNDDTLEATGLITEHLRTIFRECVFNGVRKAECDIERGQIPNDSDTKVGDVIDAVFQNSR